MPATAICLIWPTGHGARMIATSGSSTISTPRKRSSRKVSGGAYGKPNLATTKPVLQISTKMKGMAAIQRLGGISAASGDAGLDDEIGSMAGGPAGGAAGGGGGK